MFFKENFREKRIRNFSNSFQTEFEAGEKTIQSTTKSNGIRHVLLSQKSQNV